MSPSLKQRRICFLVAAITFFKESRKGHYATVKSFSFRSGPSLVARVPSHRCPRGSPEEIWTDPPGLSKVDGAVATTTPMLGNRRQFLSFAAGAILTVCLTDDPVLALEGPEIPEVSAKEDPFAAFGRSLSSDPSLSPQPQTKTSAEIDPTGGKAYGDTGNIRSSPQPDLSKVLEDSRKSRAINPLTHG
mmetsp:Transcript_4612/g.9720  ORF Transcript_4612/g.9720 Transcript_4612/m.9720 type:complete len:189 (-) Transcript_4612:70-636(-)|eukprot:CAMPEP_0194324232 /NCGR_PEP_ID=MMETSP0171-20130528/26970_1 /TAXON_ID=218684 /ORGANISM="Corethron pennatum, Strain L29A3" /LENGTH=188 /DNA_ID=CAMNT_0039083075 /DNA_START=50 /DNA_END=616 /DNA_ORIENTATION=+